MRLRLAFTFIAILASTAAASAADISAGQGAGGYGNYPAYGGIEPVIVYDFEPGVIVRTYWEPPWGNRHYFPRTGKRPKVGRLEHMPPPRAVRNETYYRHWSVSSFFLPEVPHETPPYQIRPYQTQPNQIPQNETRPYQSQPNETGP